MAGYGWERYDPRNGGIQTIHDEGNKIDITTSFTKTAAGQWGVRISGTPRDGAPADIKTTVVFYAGVEAQGLSRLEIKDFSDEEAKLGFEAEKDVVMEGEGPHLGQFKIVVSGDHGGGKKNKHPSHDHPSGSEQPLDRTRIRSSIVPETALWQAKRTSSSIT